MKVSLIIGISIGDMFINFSTIVSLFWIVPPPYYGCYHFEISHSPGRVRERGRGFAVIRMKIWWPRKEECQWEKARRYWKRNEWSIQESWTWISGDIGSNLNDSTSQIRIYNLLHSWYKDRVQAPLPPSPPSVIGYIFIQETIAI